MDPSDIPMYTTAMASRLVRLHSRRVSRWLRGYKYTYSSGANKEQKFGEKGPLVKRTTKAELSYATFLDLIDLLFIREFLKEGISIPKLRKALAEAEGLIGGHHFAQSVFFTDGRDIYLQIKDEKKKAASLMELLSGGQWVIAPFIEQLAVKVDFDRVTKYASRWYPLAPDKTIALDPSIAFGKPMIFEKGIPTDTIHDLYLAEGKKIEPVCDWMNISKSEARAALKFENWLSIA
jgi:uncharacterized protein (DUF433 family)